MKTKQILETVENAQNNLDKVIAIEKVALRLKNILKYKKVYVNGHKLETAIQLITIFDILNKNPHKIKEDKTYVLNGNEVLSDLQYLGEDLTEWDNINDKQYQFTINREVIQHYQDKLNTYHYA